MKNFQQLELPQSLLQALERLKFVAPTPIQAQAIPVALTGKDILGSAQTGTGKTMAFGIPLATKLFSNSTSTALVIAPTRELAVQVKRELDKILDRKLHKSALLIGGEPMPKQLRSLRAHPRLIVGTPGRINDHLSRGSLHLENVDFLVLDETDRMLDMGFSIQIDQILEHMSSDHQTLLFSATMPKNIMGMAAKYLKDPVHIKVGSTHTPANKIKRKTVHVTSQREKYRELLVQLEQRVGSIIVFVRTKLGAQRIALDLQKENHLAQAIHGDLRQHKRSRVIKGFRDKKYRIMVATDIAARGLDIPHIEHVINYDLPQLPEDYIHRLGRTARAGASGEALCFVAPTDTHRWQAINHLIDPEKHPAPAPEPKRSRRSRPQAKKRRFRGPRQQQRSAHA